MVGFFPRKACSRRESLQTDGNCITMATIITRLANRGARKSQIAAHKAGIANPYSINGKLIFQLPDGSVTDKYEYPKK